MRRGRWERLADRAIRQAAARWQAETGVGDLTHLTAKQEKDLRQVIRQAYPFGERRGWPYNAWLKARIAFEVSRRLPSAETPSRAEEAPRAIWDERRLPVAECGPLGGLFGEEVG